MKNGDWGDGWILGIGGMEKSFCGNSFFVFSLRSSVQVLAEHM